MSVDWPLVVASVGSLVAVSAAVRPIAMYLAERNKAEIRRGGQQVSVDLHEPEDAEMFIRDFLTKQSAGGGDKE